MVFNHSLLDLSVLNASKMGFVFIVVYSRNVNPTATIEMKVLTIRDICYKATFKMKTRGVNGVVSPEWVW